MDNTKLYFIFILSSQEVKNYGHQGLRSQSRNVQHYTIR